MERLGLAALLPLLYRVGQAHTINVVDGHDRRIHEVGWVTGTFPAQAHFTNNTEEHFATRMALRMREITCSPSVLNLAMIERCICDAVLWRKPLQSRT